MSKEKPPKKETGLEKGLKKLNKINDSELETDMALILKKATQKKDTLKEKKENNKQKNINKRNTKITDKKHTPAKIIESKKYTLTETDHLLKMGYTIDQIIALTDKKNKETLKKSHENKKDIINESEKIKQIAGIFKNNKIDNIIVHTKAQKELGFEKSIGFDLDLDTKAALFLLNHFNKKKIEDIYAQDSFSVLVPKGSGPKEAKPLIEQNEHKTNKHILVLDTSNKWLQIEKDGSNTIITIDHHGQGFRKDTSSTKIIYEILKEADLLKENPEWLENFVNFINDNDNLSFEKSLKKDFNKEYFGKVWPKTINGIANELSFETIKDLFEKGIVKKSGQVFSEEELNSEIFQTKTGTENIAEICKRRQKEATDALNSIKNFQSYANKNKIDLSNTIIGKVAYQNFRNGTIKNNLAFLAAKASGYDSFVSWNPEKQSFFINSDHLNLNFLAQKINSKIPGVQDIRNNFIFSPKNINITEKLNERDFLEIMGVKIEPKSKIESTKKISAGKSKTEDTEEKEDNKNEILGVLESLKTKAEERENNAKKETEENSTKKSIDDLRKKIEEKLKEQKQNKELDQKEKIEKDINESYTEKAETNEKLENFVKTKNTINEKKENTVFKELNPIQQSIVLQETRKIILDKIETEAIKQDRAEKNKTPYEKNAGIFKKIFSTIGNIPEKTNRNLFGNYYLAKIKKNLAEEYLHGEEFEKIKAEVAQRVKEEGIDGQVLENGKISINFLRENMLINSTEEEKEILNNFNKSANEIILYSYEQENKDKKDEIWAKSMNFKNNKNNALEAIFQNQIKNGLSEKEAIEYATSIIAKTETQVTVNRFFEQHPEAEKELEEMSKEPSFWKNMLGSFVNKQKGINFAIGGTIRATTASAIGAWTAPLAGLAIGGLMGYKKSVKGIQEDDFLGKMGENQSKKTDKNFREIIDESNPNAGLAQKLNNLSERISQEKEENKKAELIRMLENRIAFTMNKLSREEVSFGTGLNRVVLQNELANSLAKAEALKFISITELENKNTKPEKTYGEVSDRVYDFLKTKDRLIKKTRNWKIAKDTAMGAVMGAVFAEIGYQAVNYIKTHDIFPSLGFIGNTGNIDQNNPNVVQDNKNINIPTKNINTPDTTNSTQTNNPAQTQIDQNQSSAFVNIPKIKNIEVKASSLGAIQTINDLKNQILSENKGSLTNLPKGVQNILTKNSTEIAKELGLFNPDNTNESSMVGKGSTMSINEDGEVLLRDVKTGKDFVLMDKNGNVNKYTGEMFDSDANKTIKNTKIEEENPLKDKPNTAEKEITGNKKGEIVEENPLKKEPLNPANETEKIKPEEAKTQERKASPETDQEETTPQEKVYPSKTGGERIFAYDENGKITGSKNSGGGYVNADKYFNPENLKNIGLYQRALNDLKSYALNYEDLQELKARGASAEEIKYLEDSLKNQQDLINKNYGDVIKDDKLINKNITERSEFKTINIPEKENNPEIPEENEPYAPKVLNRKELVNNTFENNLKKIIKNEKTNLTWESIKDDSRDLPAHKIMSMDKNSVPERLKPFYNYLMQLKEVTRLKPIKEDEFNVKNETSEEFIKRALEKAVRRGKIEKLTL